MGLPACSRPRPLHARPTLPGTALWDPGPHKGEKPTRAQEEEVGPFGVEIWPGVFLGVWDLVNQLAGGQLSLGWHLGPLLVIRQPLATSGR